MIVLALMLISAGTMAALFSLGEDDQTEGNQVAQKEESVQESVPVKTTETEDEEQSVTDSEKPEEIQKTERTNRVAVVPSQSETAETNADNAAAEIELEDQFVEAPELAEVSASDVIAEGFSESQSLSLQWPVEGEVILEFAMDHSIYFPTLAQYQYNPAMIIAAAEGTEVVSAAAGTVTDVGKTNEYGHYVTMDLGDGFEITYGQLFDISTEVGETLEAGERIAMVAYPTINYAEEGENLYLALTKDGAAVNPELYLE